MVPEYWPQACAELAASDPVMQKLIAQYGGVSLTSHGHPFVTLARSIVGQQISVKAADSVWARFMAAVGLVTPAAVSQAGRQGLQGCGLSQRKIEYLLDLALHFLEGKVSVSEWNTLDDEAIIAQLTDVRGIGRWTAEMFLIFNLMRPNILPLDDVGLQRAVFIHYFEGEKQASKTVLALGERWQPWRTVATWYLWRSLDPVPVEY